MAGIIDNGTQCIDICKALSDRNRLNILLLLTEGELCACKINEYFKITQPTLSHHMHVLTEAGLVTVRKQGKWMHYRINVEAIAPFAELFMRLANSKQEANIDLQGDCCTEDPIL